MGEEWKEAKVYVLTKYGLGYYLTKAFTSVKLAARPYWYHITPQKRDQQIVRMDKLGNTTGQSFEHRRNTLLLN
jgi:hypothetical protein